MVAGRSQPAAVMPLDHILCWTTCFLKRCKPKNKFGLTPYLSISYSLGFILEISKLLMLSKKGNKLTQRIQKSAHCRIIDIQAGKPSTYCDFKIFNLDTKLQQIYKPIYNRLIFLHVLTYIANSKIKYS